MKELSYKFPYIGYKCSNYQGVGYGPLCELWDTVPAAVLCKWIDGNLRKRASELLSEGRELPELVCDGMQALKSHLLAGHLRDAQKLIRDNAYVNGYLSLGLRDIITKAKRD